MMATVFFMQPLGQIAGNIVTLIVVAVSKNQHHDDLTRTFDIMWRWVVGIGVVPGVIATLFRVIIPETPRFLLEIEDDPVKAEFDATTLFNETPSLSPEDSWRDLPMPAMSVTSQCFSEGRSPSQTEILQPATLNSHWHHPVLLDGRQLAHPRRHRADLAPTRLWLLRHRTLEPAVPGQNVGFPEHPRPGARVEN
jgi:hypothetical protein